jgi:mono/diheme cytochrome c family protein/uncharacterized membrane protein
MGSRLVITAVCGTVLSALLLLMPVLFPLSGVAGADWIAAMGRFHILVLHFPIALLLMVPVFEILGSLKPFLYLKKAAGALLFLGILFAANACVLGYMLAAGEGDVGGLLDQHMWAGITTTILMVFALILREAFLQTGLKPVRIIYWIVLMTGIGSLTSGSHHGASLVHGEDYLIEKLPPAWKNKFEPTARLTADSSAYKALIQPIFKANCYLCHTDVKIKGDYQMDDFVRLLEGGESGMEGVMAGDLEASELHYRITLKPNAKAFMPPGGRPPLSEEQIELIAWWINTGASETASIRELVTDDAPALVQQLSTTGCL